MLFTVTRQDNFHGLGLLLCYRQLLLPLQMSNVYIMLLNSAKTFEECIMATSTSYINETALASMASRKLYYKNGTESNIQYSIGYCITLASLTSLHLSSLCSHLANIATISPQTKTLVMLNDPKLGRNAGAKTIFKARHWF